MKRFIFGIVFLLTAGITVCSQGARGVEVLPADSDGSKRYAVVVGIDGYTHPGYGRLSAAQNDAKALSETLKQLGYEVYLITDSSGTIPLNKSIEDHLTFICSQATEKDTILFSFSGHGNEKDGKGYLIPVDFRDNDTLERSALAISALQQKMRDAKAQYKLIIMDACYSGAARSGMDSVSNSFIQAIEAAGRGIYTLASCQAGEKSYESKGNGYFTKALLEGLAGKAADADGEVSIHSLFDYAAKKVQRDVFLAHKVLQNPVLLGKGSRLVLARQRISVYPPSKPTPQPIPSTINSQTGSEPQAGDELTITLPDNVPMTFCYIPAGSFIMGSNNGYENEKPEHKVIISRPFYIGKYEVTQSQWLAVMGDYGEHYFKEGNLPVHGVSWYECQEFNLKLSEILFDEFRLPSEAEWEYACRAGSNSRFFWGNNSITDLTDRYVLYYDNYNASKGSIEVGKKIPNQWNLFDMSGNVWEWCEDWYKENFYLNSTEIDPINRQKEKFEGKVLRGGSWYSDAFGCGSPTRHNEGPEASDEDYGFRIVKTIEL